MAVEMPVDPTAIVEIAQKAGRLVVGMFDEGLQNVRSKSTAVDLVTEADVASERLLATELTKLDPAIGFWGEESNQAPDTDYAWIVDPIDGTVNYASGVPFYSISIALHQRETTLFGLVLALPQGDLYWAQRGEGAFRRRFDGKEDRLHVNSVDQLSNALLTTGFPYHRAHHVDNNTAEFTRLLSRARSVRCLGSAAIELALVAAGFSTAHWEAWLNPWDVAAGALLIEEAGGQLTTYGGAPYTFASKSVIASNGNVTVHGALIEQIGTARAGLAERKFEE